MKRIINFFTKGFVTDIDNVKVDNQSWTFPTKNIRIKSRDNNFIITPILGNTKVDNNDLPINHGEEFQLTEGFVPIGYCEHNGISYFMSYNSTTGENEIGCYPSPKQYEIQAGTGNIIINTALSGFERTYKPLANWQVGFFRKPFRTALFDYNQDVDMFIRSSFDDSVNIYICDGENYNRVVNSGFNQNGELTDLNIYTADHFNSILNQFLHVKERPLISLDKVGKGGRLKHGNYTVYVRYVAKDFNYTHFVAESPTCQVYDGEERLETISGGEDDIRSDKIISLDISNIDETYEFIELAYTRNFGNAEIQKESNLISTKHKITGSNMNIKLTGYEEVSAIDLGEIAKELSYDQISYAHTQHSNRYYGANWKEVSINNEALRLFSSKVKLFYEDMDVTFKGLPLKTDDGDNIHYENPKHTAENTGYFRTETYPFSLIFELKGGFISPAYPTRGIDALYLDNVAIDAAYTNVTGETNELGIMRFPTQKISNAYVANRIHILGLKLEFDEAIDWLGLGSEEATWMEENVVKVYVARGDRYINLKYQGLMIAGCRASGNEYSMLYTDDCSLTDKKTEPPFDVMDRGTDFAPGQGGLGAGHVPINTGSTYGQSPSEGKETLHGETTFRQKWDPQKGWDIPTYRDYQIPIFRGYAPMTFWKNRKKNNKEFVINYCSRWYCEPGFYGLFSPDFMFREINDIEDCNHLMRVAKTRKSSCDYNWKHLPFDGSGGSWSANVGLGDDYNQTAPNIMHYDIYDEYLYVDPMMPAANFYKNQTLKFKLKKVGEGQSNSILNSVVVNIDFVNYSTDYWEDVSKTLYYGRRDAGRDKIWTNRSMLTSKYIAIKNDDNYSDPLGLGGNNNLDICNLYKSNPDTISIKDVFNPQYTLYRVIGSGVTLDELTKNTTLIRYGGDCFLQRVYFKQMSWIGSKFGADDKHNEWDVVGLDDSIYDNTFNEVSTLFSHGVVLSIVVECALNPAMRYSGNSTTFFPQANIYRFAWGSYKEGKIESFLINAGGSNVLSDKRYPFWNDILPVEQTHRPTRVRYSAKQNETAYLDAYRYIDENSYEDYEIDKEDIVKIVSVGNLFIVQQFAITELITERNEFKIPASSGDLSVGFNDVLSPQTRPLANFGAAKRENVLSTGTAFYGVDINNKNMIWSCGVTNVGGDNAFLAQDISTIKLINNHLNNIHNELNIFTDKVTEEDQYEVRLGYDPYNKDVLFTLIKQGEEERPNMRRTIVYSEYMQAFLGENDYNSDFYFKINQDFYSYKKYNDESCFFYHNRENQYLMLYGLPVEMDLSFIVNGNSQEAAGSIIEKNYLAYEVEAKQEIFARATYETENQISNVNPWHDTTRFWYLPEYLEDHWKAPFSVKTDTDNQEFYQDSSLKGTWLKINLTYNENNYTFVKKVITNYIDTMS